MTVLRRPLVRLCLVLLVVPAALFAAHARQDGGAVRPQPATQRFLDAGQAALSGKNGSEAKAKFQQAIQKAKELGDVAGQAQAWAGLADVALADGDKSAAKTALAQARPLFAQAKDKRGEAKSLTRLAGLQDGDEALASLKAALSVQTAGGDNSGAGHTCLSIAVLMQERDPREGADYAKRAQKCFEDSKEKQWQTIALIVTGDLQSAAGHQEESVSALVESVELAQEAGYPTLKSKALMSLGRAFEEVGRLSFALGSYSDSLIAARDGKDELGEATALQSLGIVYEKIGRHESAQNYFRQAMDKFKAAGDQASYAAAMQNLGSSLQASGLDAQAKEVLNQAVSLHKLAGDQLGVAGCLGILGNIARESKDFATAQSNLTEAAKIFHDKSDPVNEATAIDALGSVYYDQEDYAKAINQFDRAIKLYDELQSDSFAATSYGNKAECLLMLGKLEDSAECYREAVGRFELVRSGLGELGDAKSTYLAKRVGVYRQYANVLTHLGRADQSFEIVQKMKARGLLDLLASGNLVAEDGITQAELETERKLRESADLLNTRMLQEGVRNEVGSKARYEDLKSQLREAEQKLSEFTTDLYARHPELHAKRVAETTSAEECGRLLPDDTALVEFAVCDQSVVCLVLHKVNGLLTITGHARDLSAEELQNQCAELRKACSSPTGQYAELASDLYSVLFAPASKEIEGKKRLIVCPDSFLWDVPFAVLKPDDKSSLIDKFEIDYAYSATGAMAALTPRSQPSKATKEMLVFANPDFGSSARFQNLGLLPGQRPIDTPSRPIDQPSRPIDQPSRPIDQPSRPIDQPSRPIDQPSRPIDAPSRAIDSLSRAIDSLSRENGSPSGAIKALPGTKREAEGLAALFPGATVLTGIDAQEDLVKREAKDYRYIHFATHGFVNDAAPLLSNIILAQPSKGSSEDGLLTAREIYNLKLEADMVVLSACNTARGEVRSGEGMVGLSWALFVAGCRTQVVSQWAVDDAVGADLMIDFYRSLATKGSVKGNSLRDAVIKIKQDPAHAHPYYWAPFVLVGDWH
ncbi:MAG: CHAT domain-containing protein [Armatimonadetes bacterium]|nr:CHAT domain-containing protein [Armatimonadota bacterium]